MNNELYTGKLNNIEVTIDDYQFLLNLLIESGDILMTDFIGAKKYNYPTKDYKSIHITQELVDRFIDREEIEASIQKYIN